MKKMSVSSLGVHGKRVFVRVDYNVPVGPDGAVTDDRRIRETVPTLRAILDGGGSLVLASHLGRPKGRRDPKYSLAPCSGALAPLRGAPVTAAPDCVGNEAAAMARSLAPGGVLLLENLRFHPQEEANEPEFAASLASLADLYVNDAFGSAHRSHASVAEICRHFKTPAAGLLMEREIAYLSRLMEAPAKPYCAVLGGAKAYTFLKARGVEIGASLLEADKVDLARDLEEKARSRGVRLILPVDHVEAASESEAPGKLTTAEAITAGCKAFDIGPRTSTLFSDEIGRARTILWNGPMGKFEVKGFATGTRRIASAIAAATDRGSLSVVGGGDSAAAVKAFGLEGRLSHISTGGGASLEFLSGRILPGVAALADAG